MAAQTGDRDILIPAIEAALTRWEEWKRRRTLLSSYPPGDPVLAPLATAIESCAVYKSVAGHSLFSGYSGVVLQARSLATQSLFYADRQGSGPEVGAAAADWLIRLLKTRKADGVFVVVIWGLAVEQEVAIAKGMTLIPFDQLPNSHMKRRITERAESVKRG